MKKFLTITGYALFIILILTNYKGLDYNRIFNKNYIVERYQEAKTIILKQFERNDLND